MLHVGYMLVHIKSLQIMSVLKHVCIVGTSRSRKNSGIYLWVKSPVRICLSFFFFFPRLNVHGRLTPRPHQRYQPLFKIPLTLVVSLRYLPENIYMIFERVWHWFIVGNFYCLPGTHNTIFDRESRYHSMFESVDVLTLFTSCLLHDCYFTLPLFNVEHHN